MANGILILILMLTAIAAILAGMGVFSNNRPPDVRLGQTLEDLDELKGVVNAVQKQLLQIERKLDKDLKESRTETREQLDKLGDRIDRRLAELAD
jgi:hypothetical protein